MVPVGFPFSYFWETNMTILGIYNLVGSSFGKHELTLPQHYITLHNNLKKARMDCSGNVQIHKENSAATSCELQMVVAGRHESVTIYNTKHVLKTKH